jgi:hypothetical protein
MKSFVNVPDQIVPDCQFFTKNSGPPTSAQTQACSGSGKNLDSKPAPVISLINLADSVNTWQLD